MAGLYAGLLERQLRRADSLSLAQKAAAWDKPRTALTPAERDHTLSNADRAQEVHEGAYADQIVAHYSAALGEALAAIYTPEKVLEAVQAVARLKSPPTSAVLKGWEDAYRDTEARDPQEVLKEAAPILKKIVMTTVQRYLTGAGHTSQLKAVIGQLHADSYIAGANAARQVLAGAGKPGAKLSFGLSTLAATLGVDMPADYWSTWKPGYQGAADLIQRSGGLAALLAKANQTIMGLQATTINEIGRHIQAGLAAGDSHEKVATDIGDLIRNPARCKTIANTEYNRAMTSASVDTYAANDIEKVIWLAEVDCCPLCQANEDQGAVVLGGFENGDAPVHPNCRCAVVPEEDAILRGVSGFEKELQRVLKGWGDAWETEPRGPNGEWLGHGGAGSLPEPANSWAKGGTKLSDDAARAAILTAMQEPGIRHTVGKGLHIKKTATGSPNNRASYDVAWQDDDKVQHTARRVPGTAALALLKGDHPLRAAVSSEPIAGVSPAVATAVPRLKAPDSPAAAAKAVNPGFGSDPGARINCQMCVTAYEMRRRGLDAKARPTNDIPKVGADSGWRGWLGASAPQSVWTLGKPTPWYAKIAGTEADQDDESKTPAAALEHEAAKWPVGARGVISVAWQAGGAHVINVENRGGMSGVTFIDPQSGFVGSPADWEAQSQPIKSALIARVDDKEIGEMALQALPSDNYIAQSL